MKPKTKIASSKNKSIAFGASIGIGIAMILSVMLSAGATSLVMKGSIQESAFSIFAFFVRAIAILVGALIGTQLIKEKCLLTIGIIALGYLILLLALGIVVYDGSFRGFGMGVISVITGGAIGCIVRLKSQNRSRRVGKTKR